MLTVLSSGLTFPYTRDRNVTIGKYFFLLGFQASKYLRVFQFCLFLLVYCGTICGNLLIITLVSTSKNLQTPMYIFISQLSIGDILLTTNIVPKMLQILLYNGGTISFTDCITQLYIFCVSEVFECLLLAVMSYDRYVAICNPLRYTAIMTKTCCVRLIIISCAFVFSISFIEPITIAMLSFCGPNIIDHFFCDMNPLLDIACSDTSIVHLEITFLGSPILIIPTIIIIISYAKIIAAILSISSNTGRQKAFSTCSSHLTVVSIFYWTMLSIYVFPTHKQTMNISKFLSLLYTVFTPFINPIIYSLRNNNIREAVKKILKSIQITFPIQRFAGEIYHIPLHPLN
ncbi:olfactory receptor 5I1-like [Anomaloglossus baeobatrachus]|uniref:olfactory receptor 5I1-like n=1 Tax=Anomaloglossus baeobatrachus TaxID=238106 RepID=UPI003F5082DF